MRVDLGPVRDGTVIGACPHDCPDGCGWEVTVRDGVAVDLRGQRDHPFTRGALCAKVDPYLAERVYHPDRLLHPMVRVGDKGEGRFARTTWKEAIGLIADRLRQRIAVHGPETVLPYSYCGTIGMLQSESMDRRFFHRLGATLLERTICSSTGAAAMRDTIGASIGPDPEDAGLAELIVVWGQNPLSTNLHSWRFVRGRPTVVIDAFRTRTARRADRFVQIRPGTDAALALAMARVMITEGLHDGEFVAAHTTGFDAFAAAADEWPAERAAALTGVPAETIEGLAREFAAARPLLIKSGYGLTRHANGGTMLRALACLATLTGSWRRPGGGLLVSTSGHHHKNPSALQRPDLLPTPRPRTINMVLLAEALDPARTADPPVTAMVVYAANPAAVTPDQEGILRGLTRDDLFTVVHEHFVTDTARYADVLLPATTQLEHLDVMTAWGHRHIQLNRPAIEPQGEALPNTELFRRLAAAMGFDEPCFTDSDEDLARQAIRWDRAGTTLDELATGRPHRSPSQAAPCAEGYPAPGGRFRFAGRHGDDPPRHVDLPHTGSPTALRLLSPSGHHFLNSSMANTERVRRADGEPFVVLHPDDAAARGLAEDQQVRVHNETGSFVAKLRISDDAVAGTAWTPTTRWAGDHPGSRGVNAVVPEGLTDIGNGPVFYDAQVEVSWA